MLPDLNLAWLILNESGPFHSNYTPFCMFPTHLRFSFFTSSLCFLFWSSSLCSFISSNFSFSKFSRINLDYIFFLSCELENNLVVAFLCLEVVLSSTHEWCMPKCLNLVTSLGWVSSLSHSWKNKNSKESEDLTSRKMVIIMLNICGTLGMKDHGWSKFLLIDQNRWFVSIVSIMLLSIYVFFFC